MFGGAGYDVHAVDNIDLAANRGQTLAIVGESGCGKSTLAKVLTGIELGTEGMRDARRARRSARSRSRTATPSIKRAIQMVFQNPDSHAQSQPFRRLCHGARDPQAARPQCQRGARRDRAVS